MRTLLAFLAVQFLLRLDSQSMLSAAGSSAFLFLFMLIAWKYGEWTSLQLSWRWMIKQPRNAFLIIAGTVGSIALMVYNGQFPLAAIAAEAIGGYFVFYAFCAVGEETSKRFTRRFRARKLPDAK